MVHTCVDHVPASQLSCGDAILSGNNVALITRHNLVKAVAVVDNTR